jgi:hypothetical protein
MREIVLQRFFQGNASDCELAADVAGSLERRGNDVQVHIERMASEFHAEALHLIRVCDAVLAGTLDPKDLLAIAVRAASLGRLRVGWQHRRW